VEDLFSVDLLERCAVAIFIINKDHKVVYWNSACERLTSIEAYEMVGKDHHWKAFYEHPRPCLSDLIVDGMTETIPDHYETHSRSVLLSDGWHAEGWYRNLGGVRRYIIFDSAPINDSDGHVIAALETLQDITERKHIEEENLQLARRLEDALKKLKVLSGLLPICASCKKIRDDKGYWNQLEEYIRDHSEADFSHSLCPECARKLYPELYGSDGS